MTQDTGMDASPPQHTGERPDGLREELGRWMDRRAQLVDVVMSVASSDRGALMQACAALVEHGANRPSTVPGVRPDPAPPPLRTVHQKPDPTPATLWLYERPGVHEHTGPVSDAVNHPPHYKAAGLEAIDVIEALGHGPGFCVGNAIKYLWRAGKKTPDALADLRKARWYVGRAIQEQEQHNAGK